MVRHGDGLPRVSVARHIMLYECNVYGKAHFLLIIFVTVTVTVYVGHGEYRSNSTNLVLSTCISIQASVIFILDKGL